MIYFLLYLIHSYTNNFIQTYHHRRQRYMFTNTFRYALFLSVILGVFTLPLFGQKINPNIQENYVHYTLENGLPASVIYNCVQDQNGFIWFGSLAGLIRFDGHDFYTFTKQNGLPDNEIVETAVDSFGRVWALPFSKKPVYLLNNQIYTEKNDSILKKIDNSSILKFVTLPKGDIWIEGGLKDKNVFFWRVSKNNLHKYKFSPPANVLTYSYIDTFIRVICKHSILFPQKSSKNLSFHYPTFNHTTIQNYYEMTENGFFLILNLEREYQIKRYLDNPYTHYPQLIQEVSSPKKISSAYYHNKKLYLSFRAGGYAIIDEQTKEIDTTKIMLKEAYIGGMVVDKQGNLWLATMGEGIYCMPAQPIYKLAKNTNENKAITQTIFKDEDGELFVGNSNGEIQRFKANYDLNKTKQIGTGQYNRILHLEKSIFNPQDLYIVCDEGFFIWHNYKKNTSEIECLVKQATKTVYQSKSKKSVFIGTSGALHNFNPYTKEVVVVIRKRITAISETANGQLYFGSLDGLYKIGKDATAPIHIAAQNPRLNCRVIALLPYQKTGFWVATSSDGLLLVQNDSILLQIDKKRGLSTEMLTTLYQDSKGRLWAGTIKGLHKIEFENNNFNKFHISVYNTQNGLIENAINNVKYWKDTVLVATYKGLCFFKDFNEAKKSVVKTYVTHIEINGKDTLLQEVYHLPFNKNTFSISFTGICYDCNEEITYYYRLLGKENKWQTSTQVKVEFSALSPGEYIFEVFAINEKNPIKRIKFIISPPWWKKTWVISMFFLGCLALLSAIAFYLFLLYQKRIHTKHQEEKRVKELEIQAIRAQMNPHFIFNCLSSIQYFVNSGEIDEANVYMDKFAKLIRKTLHFSQNAVNSVADEIAYIENYLQLEQMRFEDKFQYKIEIDEFLDTEDTFLPSLILQPFVENAIRHGLRFKSGKSGKLWIRFYEKNNFLVCEIEDNGIGRKKAAELKSKQHIEYQSQGMLLSQSRLELFNTNEVQKMKMEVIDLHDPQQNPMGTLIRVFVASDF